MPALSPKELLREYPQADHRSSVRECATDRFRDLKRRIESGVSWGVGAVVTDSDDRILLVRESGRWSIPGGAVEDGESHSVAAAREVREETGVDVSVDRLISVTDQTVTDGDDEVTFQFATYAATPETTTLADDPGIEDETIEAVRWCEEVPENTIDRELVRDVR
jgi:ADP-ribose pyrophosphatase YjhB (NUDIX family)